MLLISLLKIIAVLITFCCTVKKSVCIFSLKEVKTDCVNHMYKNQAPSKNLNSHCVIHFTQLHSEVIKAPIK